MHQWLCALYNAWTGSNCDNQRRVFRMCGKCTLVSCWCNVLDGWNRSISMSIKPLVDITSTSQLFLSVMFYSQMNSHKVPSFTFILLFSLWNVKNWNQTEERLNNNNYKTTGGTYTAPSHLCCSWSKSHIYSDSLNWGFKKIKLWIGPLFCLIGF